MDGHGKGQRVKTLRIFIILFLNSFLFSNYLSAAVKATEKRPGSDVSIFGGDSSSAVEFAGRPVDDTKGSGAGMLAVDALDRGPRMGDDLSISPLAHRGSIFDFGVTNAGSAVDTFVSALDQVAGKSGVSLEMTGISSAVAGGVAVVRVDVKVSEPIPPSRRGCCDRTMRYLGSTWLGRCFGGIKNYFMPRDDAEKTSNFIMVVVQGIPVVIVLACAPSSFPIITRLLLTLAGTQILPPAVFLALEVKPSDVKKWYSETAYEFSQWLTPLLPYFTGLPVFSLLLNYITSSEAWATLGWLGSGLIFGATCMKWMVIAHNKGVEILVPKVKDRIVAAIKADFDPEIQDPFADSDFRVGQCLCCSTLFAHTSETLIQLPCKHVFHKGCVLLWIAYEEPLKCRDCHQVYEPQQARMLDAQKWFELGHDRRS